MRKSSILAVVAVTITVALTGCRSPGSAGGVKSLGVVQTVPVESDKGYVEFISVGRDVPIPIYQVDAKGTHFALASVGLKAGDAYHQKLHGPTVQNLRVSEPAGEHTFVVERNGSQMRVPIREGQITPVEIDYTLVEEADAFRTYRLDHRVFQPVPYQEERLGSPKVTLERR